MAVFPAMNAGRPTRNWPRRPVKPCVATALIRRLQPVFWKRSSLLISLFLSLRSINWRLVLSRSIGSGTCDWNKGSMKQTSLGTAHVAVDPDNRLVARSLERAWNEQLLEAQRGQRE